MSDLARPTVAIAHDYLTQRGGAERVVLSMARAFPDAAIYTTLFEPGSTFEEFAGRDVRASPLNRVGLLRRHHRAALPVLPWASNRIDIDADVVVCSSSGWSHGFRSRGLKVVYCYSPARWLYQTQTYVGDRSVGIAGLGLQVMRRPLEKWDRRAAQSAHTYLAISQVVRRRIAETYDIESDVVPAPVSPEFLGAAAEPARTPGGHDLPTPFLLCVSRLLPYKNVDAVIDAFRGRRETLVVVGRGPEADRLAAAAPDNAVFLVGLSDGQMRWLYENCTGLVAASYEDFGLTPLEAGSCGRPSAVLRAGGYLDTMTSTTAVFFDRPDAADISHAVDMLVTRIWDNEAIREHAARFDEATFISRLQAEVRVAWQSQHEGPDAEECP